MWSWSSLVGTGWGDCFSEKMIQFIPRMGTHCCSEHECSLSSAVFPSTLFRPNKGEGKEMPRLDVGEGYPTTNVTLHLAQCKRHKIHSVNAALKWYNTELILVPLTQLFAVWPWQSHLISLSLLKCLSWRYFKDKIIHVEELKGHENEKYGKLKSCLHVATSLLNFGI